MAKIVDFFAGKAGKPLFMSDFSPPRSHSGAFLEDSRGLEVDFISVAYNPGKAVRVDSVALACAIKEKAGRDVMFTLATRDMNKLALESHLLGACALGLENVLVVGGDPFSSKDLTITKQVNDYRPTELIHAVTRMNQGFDFRGRKLDAPTDLCVGATLDLGRGIKAEAGLAWRKTQAGAEFFISQPVFRREDVDGFMEAYSKASGGIELSAPVFWGLQVLEKEGIIFSNVPGEIRNELASGRDGVEIAAELWREMRWWGIDAFYIVPPIMKGGARDYAAAARFLSLIKQE